MKYRYKLTEGQQHSVRMVDGFSVTKDWTYTDLDPVALRNWPFIVKVQEAKSDEDFLDDEHNEPTELALPALKSSTSIYSEQNEVLLEDLSMEELRNLASSLGMGEPEYRGKTKEKIIALIKIAKSSGEI